MKPLPLANQSRLSIAATGAYMHPLGDQTPIDCRYGEHIDSEELPHRYYARVSAAELVEYGRLVNPRCVVVWNMAGQDLLTFPDEEEAARLARQDLLVGLTDGDHLTIPAARQLIRPAKVGSGLAGNAILWLEPGARVILLPRHAGTVVPARILVLPGDEAR